MTQARTPHTLNTTPQPKTKVSRAAQPSAKPTGAGRVFKFSFKDIPTVDADMQARLQAAARRPRKNGRYPVMHEVPES